MTIESRSHRSKTKRLQKRRMRVRKKVIGYPDRPRLVLQRSHLNLFVQVIDDMNEKTLFAASTADKKTKSLGRKQWGNIDAAEQFAAFVTQGLKEKKIDRIVFDRNGRAYHGRVKAFAEALRKAGIQF